jgi:uncharacterized membrane protein required for colicin V production
MVWDCLIAWVVIVFTMVGWATGLVRCWTIPISMAVATFISQRIYVDVSTVLVETLQLEPTLSVFIAYVFTWLFIVQYCDSFLSYVIRLPDFDLGLISKAGGGLLGFTKGLGTFVLAAMVTFAQNKVPEPPETCLANLWMIQAAADSRLLPKIHLVALRLDQPIGKYVLSDSAPRFQPSFYLDLDPFGYMRKREEQRGYEFIESWKKFQQDLGNQ